GQDYLAKLERESNEAAAALQKILEDIEAERKRLADISRQKEVNEKQMSELKQSFNWLKEEIYDLESRKSNIAEEQNRVNLELFDEKFKEREKELLNIEEEIRSKGDALSLICKSMEIANDIESIRKEGERAEVMRDNYKQAVDKL